ncbi:hypothetical protein QRX60_18880 [Amycolatopsis mongoliensis]|uniref:Tox-PL domain-containing protein n=1 Tax=Amycolatopsis mongoliensis TaxID=715475 RepID=A0A9Y2JW20_9PSEU|nr:hypothetical protein [Amycolatopsis sp. 4-36]WIY05801.1 hypothetical protein QRX60_18880 [Amycolatopsis sp. 4-36]
MPEGNPLVVDAKTDPDGPGAFTAGNGDYGWAGGIGIAESSMDAFNGIKDGDWVSGGLGMLSLAGEIAGAAIDPFGYLMSSVASFLMEHVQPLKDMLDSVAGNPPVIQSYADTWGNVSKALGERKTDFDNAVKNGTTGWTGQGADAYRKFAAEHSDALSGAATVAGAISTVTMIMGQVVSFVRETVRQLIADLVGKLISWVMEEVFSLGFGTPVVVAQASAAIAKWGKKIGELLKKLTDTIRKVSPLLSKLVDIFEKIAKVFGKVLGKVSGLDGLKVKEGGFVHKIPKGEGGGVHPRAHGEGSSGGDGESSHSGDGDGSSGGDGEGSHSGEGDGSRSGETSSTGSGDPGHADGDSPSSDPMNTDSSPDSASRRSSSGDSSRSPDGSPAHAGDDSPSAHSGDGSPDGNPSAVRSGDGSPSHPGDASPSPTRSPSHAGDSSPSPTRAGDSSPSPTRGSDSTPSHAGDNTPSRASDSSPSPTRGTDSTPSHAGDSSPSPTRGTDSTPSHTGDSSPSPTRGTDSTPSHTGDSSPSPTRGSDSTPSHAGDSSPSPTRASDSTPSHTGDSSPSPTRAGDSTPSHAGDSSPSRGGDSGPSPTHSGSSPAARSDAPGSHAGTDTPSSAAPPRADGTTSASGTAPATPRTGDPGTVPSPRGGDGASSGVPPQGGAPMMGGGGMPPGGAPGGGGLGGGSPRTGGGGGWTGTPGSPGAHTPHVDAPGRPRTGGDLPAGRPRTPDAPAPAARGYGPGTHAPDTRPGGHAPGTRPHGPDGATPGHGPHENAPHENAPHDPDGAPHHGDSEPLSPEEVNARHSESTPAGSSYHAGDPEMGDLPHRVQPDPDGRYTVDVHVTPDGHARIGDRLYTPEEFADILRRNGDYDGRPVRLIGCDASSNDFAHRLSRELDTEVMAPTKPAWTDSHGRVFSSDYEIGPDGKMRPRIPPDGEWNSHRPDGSTHRAGDDGFAPDTHHGDPHDVDADSAQHRGERYIDDEPVDIEHPDREPRAPMKEKINDPDYREKYYDGPNKNGEYARKNADQVDAVEDRLPKIKEDKTKPEGERFESKSDDFEEATYHDKQGYEHSATQHQKDEAQDLIERRHEANQRAREAEADYQDAKKNGGTVDEEIERERSEAHRDRTDLGEELGEHAARDAIADKFPSPPHEIKELPDPELHGDNTRVGDKPGSGRFDQIYEVTGPDGKPKIVVVEAKGPNAGLGTRQGPAGDQLRYEQGHPKYVESIIQNMERNGTEAEQNLAEDLRRAMKKGNLDYYVAKARVRDEFELDPAGNKVPDPDNPGGHKKRPVYGGYNLKHFDLSDRPPKNRGE